MALKAAYTVPGRGKPALRSVSGGIRHVVNRAPSTASNISIVKARKVVTFQPTVTEVLVLSPTKAEKGGLCFRSEKTGKLTCQTFEPGKRRSGGRKGGRRVSRIPADPFAPIAAPKAKAKRKAKAKPRESKASLQRQIDALRAAGV